MSPTILLLVLDAVGITTLEYLLDMFPGQVSFPNLSRLGLGSLLHPRHATRFGSASGQAYAARLDQASASADSVVGHREMMGLIDDRTYDLFPNGFPEGFMAALEERIGRKTLCNEMGGGDAIIVKYAAEHRRTGRPIVYASKCDPLIQLAMDEAVIPVTEQHRIADVAMVLAREMGFPITRAIARAYIRTPGGEYVRTANRHDAVLPLSGPTLVDILRDHGVWVVAVGKTGDLVNTAYDETIHLTDPAQLDPARNLRFPHPKDKDTNPFNVQGTLNALASARAACRPKGTFVFANLVDTDALYGHARDVEGALRCLEEFDRVVPMLEAELTHGGMLAVTADHGMQHRVDYGYHNREPLPFMVERLGYGADLGGLARGTGEGLTEVGMIIAGMFGCVDEFQRCVMRVQA